MSSSEKWGGGTGDQYGKYSVKIYTIDGVLIYQVENGTTNIGMAPSGGVAKGSLASSMIDAIANPITFYGSYAVINQEGHSGDLYNYYWTSYSRGTDGRGTYPDKEPYWHNDYLDGYIPLRVKSIYDPCPYLYRIPSNGIYNKFAFNPGWTWYSYLGGASWNLSPLDESWFSGLGLRNGSSSVFENSGGYGWYYSSTVSGKTNGYDLRFEASHWIVLSHNYARSYGMSVRCIGFGHRNANDYWV